ncbi:hypothetical protein BC941DRAFT_470773 [Chlamydoabsidia padenii]|nr:hypothetical protein BC941DRAFT_470773 [Chlamydoabsidia padenii]
MLTSLQLRVITTARPGQGYFTSLAWYQISQHPRHFSPFFSNKSNDSNSDKLKQKTKVINKSLC